MADAKSKADGLIHDNAVMIFSKTWCSHCAHSKKILTAKQKEYEAKGTPFSLDVYELDQASDGDDIQDFLKEKTSKRTVPRIFVAEKELGGRDNLDEVVATKGPKGFDEYWLKNAVHYTATGTTLPGFLSESEA
ncbi:hypothetical protein EPUS_08492 [Endocarpon pusillum Z07020]|uniref:Glutaredoxin n=2 Tax=Endocarpon pusillum TaxID=364733 RepID=F4ZWY0_9EURO|nr:uncharacterized protein EPUS_08492 [Endocarpon pusillum Z07020]ADO17801.1 glutaredoxin [Endocarpon pusillum]AEH41481.1 glutaredoxin [Endocarpon pusillum]ERF72879.1 hypothetical protein EPUS_08492 [Endocarpon pusillum Z07020]